ncbi:MFS transporter [Mesorhizobium sp. DCY119]|uniref:MFS transporter n=1 Tax=Mesorhizobium sp. DCY119 TaxID=2108445 RepID=UPI000E72F0B5|nr:MFS transporter [Mesorhizobium sp. DCY119]RJG41220.1 MFS transporter [Mesorhizobium sp. DCY119]
MANAIHAEGASSDPSLRDRTIKKLNLRIVLFCFICFIVNYLDRVNIGFAALHMNEDIGLTPYMFGLGAGIFFIGYLAFEIPSNMILHKIGPRIWIARIMVTWGIVSCAMAFVQGPTSFYILRFLLGVAETGFAPGVLLYLTYWYPAKERGRATALFMAATVLSIVIGAPISGWLIDAGEGLFGLHGWQAMFILEGLPAVLLGIFTFFYLVDSPQKDSKWLAEDEKAWLLRELAADQKNAPADTRYSLREIFRDYRIWMLTIVYMFNGIAVYGVIMWLPQIVKSIGDLTTVQAGFVSAIPFVFAAIGLVVISRNSDRTGERKIHTAIAGLFGGLFLAASALAPNAYIGLLLLCACAFFLWSYLGVFWTLPTQFLSGTAAAGGLAAINGFAQIGGFTGPYIVGWVKTSTDSFSLALLTLAVFPIIGFFVCMSLKARRD